MILDGALADTKIRGNILAGVSRKDERHDLMLTWRELSDMARRILPPGG